MKIQNEIMSYFHCVEWTIPVVIQTSGSKIGNTMANFRQGEPPSTQRENHLSSLKIYDGKKRWDVLCVCCFLPFFHWPV